MTKKILTSIAVICIACPVMAESFPQDGYMQENTTYEEAANYDNMGVYSGEVSATAEYDDIQYRIAARKYLAAGGTEPDDCPSGNYCPGLQNTVTYDENNAQGLENCPSGYPNSATGASADTECYKSCTTANVAHSASVTGNDYYGNGVDTCSATSCENGYHTYSTGYSGPNVQTTVGNVDGQYFAGVSNNGEIEERDSGDDFTENGFAYYGLSSSDHNSFAADFGSRGMVYGYGRCSTQVGYRNISTQDTGGPYVNVTQLDSLTDETGVSGAQYCYCKVTGYKPYGETRQDFDSPWTFRGHYNGDWSRCAENCAANCAYAIQEAYNSDYVAFRGIVLGSIEYPDSPAICEANTITINWSDVDPEYAGDNNEGTTTYDGDRNTPVKAVTKPGKTFVGWKFVKPAPQSEPGTEPGDEPGDEPDDEPNDSGNEPGSGE